jgi:hypothetical protein
MSASTMPDRDPELQLLLDKQALHEVLMRYCRGVDRMDPELIASVFHPDAIDDHGIFSSTRRDDFVEWVIPFQARFTVTAHMMTNEYYEVFGDVAFGEAYAIMYSEIPPADGNPPQLIKTTGRYVDRFERRDGEWRIAHRRLIIESDETANLVDHSTDLRGEEFDRSAFVQGTRDRSDPSYDRA